MKNAMKYAFVLLLFAAAAVAHAGEPPYLESRNEAGGKIVLLPTKPSDCNGWRSMYSTGPNGELAIGCWRFRNELVQAVYADGTVRMYNAGGFRMVNPPDIHKGSAPRPVQ